MSSYWGMKKYKTFQRFQLMVLLIWIFFFVSILRFCLLVPESCQGLVQRLLKSSTNFLFLLVFLIATLILLLWLLILDVNVFCSLIFLISFSCIFNICRSHQPTEVDIFTLLCDLSWNHFFYSYTNYFRLICGTLWKIFYPLHLW